MYYYLPSCQFTALLPDVSKKWKDWFAGPGHISGTGEEVTVTGCCRPTQKLLGEGDTVIALCQTCMAITREVSPKCRVVSLYEYILSLPDFPWPDLHGEEMTVQDCFRARNDRPQQLAVRECLRCMNIVPVELEENYEKTMFDGAWLMNPVAERNLSIAPVYFNDIRENYARPLPEEEQERLLAAHAAKYRTKRVLAYCNACLKGIKKGGADGVHLAQLLSENL